jgi:hypothetical protein
VCTACCCMLHYFRVLLRSEFIIEAVASAKPLNYPAGQNHRKARSEQGTQVSDSITFPGLGCGGCRASMYQPVASGSAPACRTLRKLARPPGRLLTRIGGAGILDHGQPATAVRARYAETFSFSLSLCYPRANPMLHFSIPIEAALATQPAVLLQSLGQTQARGKGGCMQPCRVCGPLPSSPCQGVTPRTCQPFPCSQFRVLAQYGSL